jgi:hypothetical protein
MQKVASESAMESRRGAVSLRSIPHPATMRAVARMGHPVFHEDETPVFQRMGRLAFQIGAGAGA